MTVTELVVLWTPAVNVGTHPTRIHGLTAAAGYRGAYGLALTDGTPVTTGTAAAHLGCSITALVQEAARLGVTLAHDGTAVEVAS